MVTGGTVVTGGTTRMGGTVVTGGTVVMGGTIATGGIGGTTAVGSSTKAGGSIAGNTATGGACGLIIDYMEAGTGRICQGNGRVGMWFTYIDTDVESAISPATSGMALPTYMSTLRGSNSYYAMHMQGYYYTYAGIACWLNKSSFSGSTGTYDASAYTGITFWAKGGGNGGDFNVVGQMASTEKTIYGGTCTASSCSGPYYKLTGLSSTTWQQYKVPFTYLTGGTVKTFDPQSTWSFEFQFYNAAGTYHTAFDLWIDDLSFY
jgi:hypothetical protein